MIHVISWLREPQTVRASKLFGFLWAILTVQQSAFAAGPGSPANWLLPASGNWSDASHWSSADYPNNGSPTPTDTYEVTLNAIGAAHTVTLQNDVSVNSVTLDSPDVTLFHENGILTADLITINQGVYQFGSDSNGFPSGHEIVGATIVGKGGELRVGRRNRSSHVMRDVVLDIDLTVLGPLSTPAQPLLTIEEGLSVAAGRTLELDRRDSLMLVNGSQTIDGPGEIVFTDSGVSDQRTSGSILLSDGTTFTLGPSLTLRAGTGRGSIGHQLGSSSTNTNLTIINQGRMSSSEEDAALEIFYLNPSDSATFVNEGIVEAVGSGKTIVGGDWTNSGTFRIRDNGILQLAGSYKSSELGTIDRLGGELRLTGQIDNVATVFTSNANTGSIVIGQTGSLPTQLMGGTIDAIDGTNYRLETSQLHDVTLAARADVFRAQRIDVHGNLTLLDGQIRFLDSLTASSGELWFREATLPQRLQGNGSIDFEIGRDSRITIQNELTIEPDIVVQTLSDSRGQILNGKLISQGILQSAADSRFSISVAELVNEGTIDVLGTTIIGRDRDATWHNDGLIHVKAGAQLDLNGTFEVSDIGNLVNEGGQIRLAGALDNRGLVLDLEDLNLGVPLTLAGGHILGGTVTSTGATDFEFISGNLNAPTFNGVTLAKNLTLPGDARMYVENGITFDQVTVTMEEGAELFFTGDGPQTLDGPATIIALNRPNASAIAEISGDRLRIGEDIVIRNGTDPFRELRLEFEENRGLIIAEAPDTFVSIGARSSAGSWKNEGTIRVEAGYVEFLGTYDSSDIGDLVFTGGQVRLEGIINNVGQTIVQNSRTGGWRINGFLTGGRIESTDQALPILNGWLTDITIAGRAQIGDGISNIESVLSEKIALDEGMLTIARRASLGVNTPVPIEGQGTIFLNGTVSEPARLLIYTGGELMIGPDIAIHSGPQGGGIIGGGNFPLINYGTISAQTAGQRIIVDGAFENFGLLEASNGSALLVETDHWVNQGTIRTTLNGILRIHGSQFENGVDGTIEGAGSLTITDPTFVNRGTISPGNSIGSLVVTANLEFAPTSALRIELGQNGASDLLSVNGNVSLSGVLDIFFDPFFTPQLGQRYEILRTTTGFVTGAFANDRIEIGRRVFDLEYAPKGVFLTTTAIPEPSALLLTVAMMAVLAAAKWKRAGR